MGARAEGERVALAVRSRGLALACEIQAPVPGTNYIGIEVPNAQPGIVSLRPVVESEMFFKIKSPLALALGQLGARLALCARGLAGLQGTAAVVSLTRPALALPVVIPCDVADPDSVRSLYGALEERLGGVDVLVNNASNKVIHFKTSGSMVTSDKFSARIAVGGGKVITQSDLPGLKHEDSDEADHD